MKNTTNFLKFIIVSAIVIFQGCKSREINSPSTSKSIEIVGTIMDTLWRTQINDYSMTPILNFNKDVLVSKMFNDLRGEVFQLYSGQDGSLLWEWSDYFSPEQGFLGASKVFYKDVFVISNSYKTYAFNAINGKTLWRDNQQGMYGDNSMAIDEDGYIYHSFRDIGNGNRNIYFWRTKYDKIKWEQVCVYSDSVDNGKLANMNMIVSKNEKGEKILVYTPVLFRDFDGVHTHASKVIAYNIDLKKKEWQIDYNPDNSNIQFWKTEIKAKNDKIYIFAVTGNTYFLMAYNITDGKLAFKKQVPNFGVGLHFYNDMIIPLCNGNSPITAYDMNTGVERWEIDFLGKGMQEINFAFEDSYVYKNYLISTQCSKMLAINLDNGKEVYYDAPKVMGECLQFGIAINEEKRWFYVQDRKYINCYTLPSQIK